MLDLICLVHSQIEKLHRLLDGEAWGPEAMSGLAIYVYELSVCRWYLKSRNWMEQQTSE